MLAAPRRLVASAALCVGLLAGGCDGSDEGTPALTGGAPVGEGGTLVWAVADPVNTVDPLEASTRSERIAARQVNEPLTAQAAGPFDAERQVRGLAVDSKSSASASIWTFTLRGGVTFQDGSPLNSAAVLANATRWQTTPAGQAILPNVVSVDTPTPGQIRFVLSGPDPGFPRRLARPELGIVSPRALEPRSGEGAVLAHSSRNGTGAFEIRERRAARVLLARNTDWWGARAKVELGPALEQVELRVTSSPSLRLAMLDAGEAQLADELDGRLAEQAERDPLLSVMPSEGETFLGVERSVRGIDSGREIPVLSAAWLTGISVPG